MQQRAANGDGRSHAQQAKFLGPAAHIQVELLASEVDLALPGDQDVLRIEHQALRHERPLQRLELSHAATQILPLLILGEQQSKAVGDVDPRQFRECGTNLTVGYDADHRSVRSRDHCMR